MKLLLTFLSIVNLAPLSAQVLTQDILSNFEKYEAKVKHIESYESIDGTKFSVGDSITIRERSQDDRYVSFVLNRSMANYTPVTQECNGCKFPISKIEVVGKKKTGYIVALRLGPSFGGHTLYVDAAIKTLEIDCNSTMIIDAKEKLKSAKEDLDLGIISQAEYDQKLADYKKLAKQ